MRAGSEHVRKLGTEGTLWAPVLLLLGMVGAGCGGPFGPKARECEDACDALIECGVLFDRATCSLSCQGSSEFSRCAGDATNDCNALALCAFEQNSADHCGGSSGVPRGSESCADVADCEGKCSVAGGSESCSCSCRAKLAPAAALELLVNDQCALARCPEVCLVSGLPSPACVTCFGLRCQDKSDACSDEVPASSNPNRSDAGHSDAAMSDSNRQGVGPASDGGAPP